MNEVDWLRALKPAEQAVPAIDVTAGVASAVRERSSLHEDDRVHMAAAAIAAIIGVAAILTLSANWSAVPEPANAFGESVNLVLR